MKSLAPLLASLCAWAFSIAIPASAATFTVNTTVDAVDAHPGDGVCETGSGNGICSLRAAIQEAGALTNQNTIVIPPGTFTLSQTPACTYQLVMNTNVLTENMSALCVRGNVIIAGAGAALTIIDAGGEVPPTCCLSFPSARGIVTDLNAVVQLSGVTIQHAISNGGFRFFGGGAINNQGHLTVTDCLFTANTGIPGGSGIYNNNVLTVENSTFSGNFSTGSGGGGAIFHASGTASISNSTITFNTSATNGGGIFFVAPGSISNTTVDNNSASAGHGGGIYLVASATLTNVTISNNRAIVGGGLYIADGITTANNLTVVGNHITNHAAGIDIETTLKMGNSVLFGNYVEPNTTRIETCNGAIQSTGHNLLDQSDANCTFTGSTTDRTGVNPLLGPLGNNGGPVQTHSLLPGSPAIDGGDPGIPGSGGGACAASDARGFLRPLGVRCDVGAFESGNVITLTTVAPKHAGNFGTATLSMGGNGFVAGLSVVLRRSGQADIVASQVNVADGASSVTASFGLTNAATGVWDVIVTNPDNGSSTLPGAFTINPGGSPNVYSQLVGPVGGRAGQVPVYYLLYGNSGDAEALAVPVSIHTQGNYPMALAFQLSDPPAQTGQVVVDWSTIPLFATPLPSAGFVNVPLLIPVIPPGTSGLLPFKLTIPSTAKHGDTFSLTGEAGDPWANPAVNPTVVSGLTAGAIAYAQSGLGVAVPPSKSAQIDSYVTTQIENLITAGKAAYIASAGANPQVYSLTRLNLDAAEFAAFGTSAGSVARARQALKPHVPGAGSPGGCSGAILKPGQSCGTSGDNNVEPPDTGPKPFTPADCRNISGHQPSSDGSMCVPKDPSRCPVVIGRITAGPDCDTFPIVSSIDPNLKSGPSGSGDGHFLAGAQPMNYLVEFENEATASAAAQTVVVTDQLDTATLDLSTFSFGPITFSHYLLTPPPGVQQFTGALDLRPDMNIAVKVDANLSLATGLVTWKFASLDPTTLQPTPDPTAGFLPPDVTPPQGLANLLYSISPKTPIASGTTICNQAIVTFDTNPPISTQSYCNTIDAIAPASQVTALPPSEATSSFTVQWSGADAGSEILDYTIAVSDNGGAFTPWLSHTALTQSTFSGVSGHSYGFFSIARDGVLNVEGSKNAAETSTTVSGAQCATDVTSQFHVVQGGYRFNAATQRFVQQVTITLNSGTLSGPFAIATKSLGANASLFSQSGSTSCIDSGSSYLLLNPGATWNAGQTLMVTLEFVDPTKAAVTYTPVVLQGSPR